MSRAQQDSVIDDDEETCPLCIEEFDLGDKNFRPCPCGYQICQFCFNSLKNTYDKSTCPNCRRPYDEKTIQYKIPTAEDIKQDLLNKNKKQIAAKRRENEKKEVEASSRRNLAGVRVKQQNLVYVIGLVPTLKDEQQLLQTLRGDNYFGQYGEIEKIVVSKAKPGAANQGIGVYVTFARKDDAALCISMVDGSQNGDRILRAQYGTTKYCSAYLRGETCNNKNCTFLHESGEDSQHNTPSMEPAHPKRPLTANQTSFPPSNRPGSATNIPGPGVSQVPRPQVPKEESSTGRKGSSDTSALPTTASWATKDAQQAVRVRRESQTLSRSSPSPQVTNAKLATTTTPPTTQPETKRKETGTPPVGQATKPAVPNSKSTSSSASSGRSSPKDSKINQTIFDELLASINSPDFRFIFDDRCFSKEDLAAIYRLPTLIDPYGGAKRRMMREKVAKLEAEAQEKLQISVEANIDGITEEENLASGSLQLGGEPDDMSHSIRRGDAIGRPVTQLQANNAMSDQFSNLSIDGRSLTPHQRQQLALLSSASVSQSPGPNQQTQTGFTASGFDPADQRSNLFANQQMGFDGASGHARQSSRYSFANETAKSTTNARYGQQQNSTAQQQHFYSSGVQGPPPGLKTAGTPPISGGGMFAQGHGFTSNMNTNFGNTKDGNSDMFLRGRSGTGSGIDTKHDQDFPPLGPPTSLQPSNPVSRFFPMPASYEPARRSGTPKVPPGLGLPHGHPNLPPGLATPDRIRTPAIPPGLGTPGLGTPRHGTPGLGTPDRVNTPAQHSNIVAPVLPLIPTDQRSGTPIRPIKPTNDGNETEAEEQISPSKPHAISTGSPKAKVAKPEVKPAGPETSELKDDSSKEKPESKTQPRASKAQKVDLSPIKSSASPVISLETTKLATLEQASVATSASVSRPGTPGTTVSKASDPSSLPRPRTIRLTTTSTAPKPIEVPPPSATGEKFSGVPAIEALKTHSRRPSIVSLSRSSRPGSPAISDMAASSMNLSRAGSPPPSIVGSAPEKLKSKNQLKKERKAKAKESLEDGGSSASISQKGGSAQTPLVEDIGPILSRQKKKKKTKESASVTKAKADSSAAATSDEKASEVEIIKSGKESPTKKSKKAASKPQPEEIKPAPKPPTPEPVVSPPQSKPATPPPPPPPEIARPYIPTLRDFYTELKEHAASTKTQEDIATLIPELLDHYITDAPAMLAQMFQSGEIDPTSALFSPPSLTSYRLPNASTVTTPSASGRPLDDAAQSSDPNAKKSAAFELTFGPQGSFSGQYAPAYPFGTITLTTADRKALIEGHPIRINDPSRPNDLHHRVLITARGTVYRHMSVEEEDRILELESRMDDASLQGLYGSDDIDDGLDDEYGNDYGDFENLRGGVEELIRKPARHGIVWVSTGSSSGRSKGRRKADHQATRQVPGTPEKHQESDNERHHAHDGYDQDGEEAGGLSEEVSHEDSEDSSSFGDEDLLSALPTALQSDPNMAMFNMPAHLRPRPSTNTITAKDSTASLRTMDVATLINRINSSKADMDALKKEVESLEKKVIRRGKDVGKWRDTIMTTVASQSGKK